MTDAERIAQLETALEAAHRALITLREELGECYLLSGADPDGNERARLAPHAVEEVRRLRADYDEACEQITVLTQARDEAQRELLERDKFRDEVYRPQLAALSHQLTEAQEALFVNDGQWICETCGFRLTRAVLHAPTGAVGADRSELQDVCPNDGTSMRRLTWKEDAENANRVGREAFKRLSAVEAQLTAAQQREQAVREALSLVVRNCGHKSDIDCSTCAEARAVLAADCSERNEQHNRTGSGKGRAGTATGGTSSADVRT